ncbi:hypothetical protein [Streptomyces antimycoticus]|uniref:hypothetical protein n=1 Tax=Streptomyces antimycoticus TaxID=68175 RepID=UPI003864334A|nr:hypothetical protein OG751_04370 [Streptomyces antimycoticus]
MSPAVAFALHVAALIAVGASTSWAIRWRRRSRLADRIIRAQQRARLQQHMHLRRSHDTRPAPVDQLTLQLEALYRAPAHTERGNQ